MAEEQQLVLGHPQMCAPVRVLALALCFVVPCQGAPADGIAHAQAQARAEASAMAARRAADRASAAVIQELDPHKEAVIKVTQSVKTAALAAKRAAAAAAGTTPLQRAAHAQHDAYHKESINKAEEAAMGAKTAASSAAGSVDKIKMDETPEEVSSHTVET